jgi:HK97 family phage major capsid protein
VSNTDVAKGLVEERNRAWDEAKAILSKGEEPTPEERTKVETINGHLDVLDARIKDILEGEKRARETDDAYNTLAGKKTETRGGSDPATEEFRSMLKGIAGQDVPDSVRDRVINLVPKGKYDSRLLGLLEDGGVAGYGGVTPWDAQQALRSIRDEQRSLGAGSVQGNITTTAGPTVPVDFYDRLLAFLVQVSGIMQTGPTIMHTPGGETINIPVVSAHPAPAGSGITAEGAAIASGDPSFATQTLASVKFGWFGQVSRELLDDTGIDLLGYLAMAAGRAVGNDLGNALINGGGVSGSLLSGSGKITQFTTGTATGTLGVPGYKDLVNLQYSVTAPYRQSRSCYWLMQDQTVGQLRTIVDTVGRPIWEPSTVLGSPDLLLGKPLVADPFMPATALSGVTNIVFGDFAQFVIRLIGGVRFERSDDYAFNEDLVSFRALTRADGRLTDQYALAALKTSSS